MEQESGLQLPYLMTTFVTEELWQRLPGGGIVRWAQTKENQRQ